MTLLPSPKTGESSHRAFEIASRLGKPATSLSRPLGRLLEMDLVVRETPFGSSARGTKRTLYRIADPFLRFWFGFVEPDRSRLEARRIEAVEWSVAARFAHHVGGVWEELARASVPRLRCFDRSWGPASRWCGAGLDRRPIEVDLVAEGDDGDSVLVGEVKWAAPQGAAGALEELEPKAERLPFLAGRRTFLALWLKTGVRGSASRKVFTPRRVLEALH